MGEQKCAGYSDFCVGEQKCGGYYASGIASGITVGTITSIFFFWKKQEEWQQKDNTLLCYALCEPAGCCMEKQQPGVVASVVCENSRWREG